MAGRSSAKKNRSSLIWQMLKRKKSFENDGPSLACPLFVGVAGHHDLRPEEIPDLEHAFRGILRDLRGRYVATPLVLLTGLAEGADRLASKIAAEEGIKTIALVPREPARHVEACHSTESRQECDRLLEQSSGRLSLPHSVDLSEQLRGRDSAREDWSAIIGGFLADKSHVLVVFWNGDVDAVADGSARVIEERLRPSCRDGASKWQHTTAGEVRHVMTGRRSTGPVSMPGRVELIRPPEGGDERREIIESIAAFNTDLARIGVKLCPDVETGRRRLWPSSAPLHAGLNTLGVGFATFDAMAGRWQKASNTSMNILFGLSWAAVLLLQLCSGPVRNVYTIGGYLGCVGLAWSCFVWSQRRGHQPRHLEYRAIAEAMRVQFFWRMTGIGEDVANLYLATHGSVLSWIRSAVATITILADATSGGVRQEPQSTIIRDVDKAWLTDQESYFNKAAKRDRIAMQRRKSLATSCFAIGSILTVVYILTGFPDHLVIPSGLLLATGALVAGHTEGLALDEHANQYRQMASFFGSAKRVLGCRLEAGDLGGALNVLREAGSEAIGESSAWVLLHKSRPLRAPKP